MRHSTFPGSDVDFFDRQICMYFQMCFPGQPWTIFPSLCPRSPWLTQLFPLPSLCNPNYLSPWPVRNKAQSGLKRSRKRRKVIKENLMVQQTLLGSPLKRAWLFQPYQLQLWWVFCCCSSWGNIQVRSPWLPGRGFVSQCQPVAFIPVSLRGALCLLNKVSPLTSMSPEVLTHFEFIETWVLTICFGYSRLVKMLL